jgi:hypothetical protein
VVAVSGTATHSPAHARVALQGRVTGGWHTLQTVVLRGERFTLHWHVRTREFQLRATLLSGRRRIAASAAVPLLVGSAIVRCHPAAAPADLLTGDGWIQDGVYLQGGPAPGMDQCQGTSSTVTATTDSGQVVASQNLAGATATRWWCRLAATSCETVSAGAWPPSSRAAGRSSTPTATSPEPR